MANVEKVKIHRMLPGTFLITCVIRGISKKPPLLFLLLLWSMFLFFMSRFQFNILDRGGEIPILSEKRVNCLDFWAIFLNILFKWTLQYSIFHCFVYISFLKDVSGLNVLINTICLPEYVNKLQKNQ